MTPAEQALSKALKEADFEDRASLDRLYKALAIEGYYQEVHGIKPVRMPQIKDIWLLGPSQGPDKLYLVTSVELYPDETEEMVTITAKLQTWALV